MGVRALVFYIALSSLAGSSRAEPAKLPHRRSGPRRCRPAL
jgi:hypothetical protein